MPRGIFRRTRATRSMRSKQWSPAPGFANGRLEEDGGAANDQERAAQERRDLHRDQCGNQRDEHECRQRQAGIGEEHGEECLGDLADDAHRSASAVERRSIDAVARPTTRKMATKTSKARSWPGQAM